MIIKEKSNILPAGEKLTKIRFDKLARTEKNLQKTADSKKWLVLDKDKATLLNMSLKLAKDAF